MSGFETKTLPIERDAVAPDGSDVRLLLRLAGGGMAHFELPPGETARAVRHPRVEEIWFVLSGRGEMWRRQDGREEIVVLEPGVSLSIPVGTEFQFRSFGSQPLGVVGVTMPPWQDDSDAVKVQGRWTPTVRK
jgi:mannose-6-phosphate isomerase-like protein (cupin superfamily)